MRHILVAFLLLFSLMASAAETIVIVRHGEKPKTDLGQLSCQGLNRSLMLPAYFHRTFPKPNFIFAPNPGVTNAGYNYVRPLATIEPTAIALTMPVNTMIGFNDPQKLVSTLLQKKYHDQVIYVAWEHVNIMKIAHLLLQSFHSKASVPVWSGKNFNMVFVFTIHWHKKPANIQFKVASEGMYHLSRICPK